MKSNLENLNILIEAIHNFYPIGNPYLGTNYSGYKNYNEILFKKINNIINGEKTAWVELIESIKKDYDILFFDMGYLQFPCYLAKFEIQNDSDTSKSFTQTLVINISLLCNYYTIFLQDNYTFKNYTESITKPSISILYTNQKVLDLNNFIQALKKKIETYFPKYEYINHKNLFDYKINGGHPYTVTEEEKKIFNIYQFLFDGLFQEDFLYIFQ